MFACQAHGFEWIGRGREEIRWFLDLDLGAKERRVVEAYIPDQCLPYDDRRPHGLVMKANGEVPDCLGTLFMDGHCPD